MLRRETIGWTWLDSFWTSAIWTNPASKPGKLAAASVSASERGSVPEAQRRRNAAACSPTRSGPRAFCSWNTARSNAEAFSSYMKRGTKPTVR